ncbi:MAG: WD40 repeat domain-containing protein [Vicinamibacterales bacterium]|nr:WD40 repeat domain-containing protein [Vicinamibacterales bacterium]
MRTRFLTTALCAIAAAATLSGAVPSVWQASGAADFLKGDIDGLSVDSRGGLMLAPGSAVLHDPATPFVWTLVEGADGVFYAGTGNDGRVIRTDAAGRTSVVLDSEELEVHALAAAPGGGLFAGSSPDGAVYRIDAAGKVSTFFDPPDRYIWSLALDPSGNLFVATGDKGVIYKVAPSGASSIFYAAKATHAMTLAFDGAGRLVVGTESPGRVIQLDATGKPFVLIDSPHTEIHSLRLGPDGALYAVASTAKPAPAGAAPRPAGAAAPQPAAAGTPTVSVEITSVALVPDSTTGPSGASPPAAPSGGSGAIYRIQQDGLWDLLWESHEDVPYDVAVDADGGLLVGTGNRGRLFRLYGNPADASLVTRTTAQHVTALLRARSGSVLYATSNPGRLVRLGGAPATGGTYESDVRDAQTVSTWGVIRWRASTPAGARVVVATRTGNTKTPDETWSAWSTPYTTPTGSAVTSPKARYFQWRVALHAQTETPVLTSIAATYLQRNVRPKVALLTVHPPGTVFQRPYPSGDPDLAGYDLEPPERKLLTAGAAREATPLGKKVYEKGLMTFQWRGEDENGDDLVYDVLYRHEGETTWRPIKQQLPETLVVWDTASVPDGTYILRVVASDLPTNPAAAALTGHLDSVAFDVDNTPPTVTVSGVRRDGPRVVLTIDVRDTASAIRSVEYTLDSRRWQPLYPTDGLADSREERVELVLEGNDVGRTVVVRALDALLNSGSATVADTATATPAPPARR